MWSLITLPFRLAWTAITFVWDIFWGAASLVFGVVGSIVSLLFGTVLLGGLIGLGTLICAFGLGPFVQFFTRHFSEKVLRYKPEKK